MLYLSKTLQGNNMITREYLESLSIENARSTMRAICAEYDEVTGEQVSIVDNVTHSIKFAVNNEEAAEQFSIVY